MQPARTSRLAVPALVLLALLAAACGAPAGRQITSVAAPSAAEGDVSAEEPSQTVPVPSDEVADPTTPVLPVPDEASPPPSAPATVTEAVPPAAPPAPAAAVGSSDVEAVLAGLSLEQRVGQLFSVAVIGDDANDPSAAARSSNTSLFGAATPAEIVQRYHLGGVAYFAHDLGERTSNVADLTRTANLSTGLQAAAAADSGVGLLIAADQEGGLVVRLRAAPATVFPAAREVGNLADRQLAFDVGAVTGREARALGINWVFAPVADVNVNPDNPVIGTRAFGVTAAAVTPMVTATAEGLLSGGVLPTAKHYPGHGDTNIDSHSSLPTIDHSFEELSTIDLPPFQAAAQMPLMSVMVGHLAVPSLDPSGTPATLSAPIMSVLRDQIGFQGLVVTDAMNMGALSGFGDAGTLAIRTLQAGVDIVLMPTDLPAAYNAVLAAAQDGRLPQTLIDNAVRRVLATKAALGILDANQVQVLGVSGVGTPEHRAVREALRSRCDC